MLPADAGRRCQLILDEVGCFIDSFQDFEAELSELPGRYAAERGGSLLLLVSDSWLAADPSPAVSRAVLARARLPPPPDSPPVCACVGVKSLGGGVAEIKRLYVRPAVRRYGVARLLTGAIEREAARLGHTRLRLDTLERLGPALRLYEACGFHRTAPYVHNPLSDAVFMEKEIGPG